MDRETVLNDLINRVTRTNYPLVVLMCGVAGSGKTTFAQQLVSNGFIRLSIDEEIWKNKGRFGIDYPAENYEQYKAESEMKLRSELINLINEGSNVVVDFSFWQQSKRNEYKQLIKAGGGESELVYLKVHPEVIRERLRIRGKRFDANAAFPITEEILSSFLEGFEIPQGEGEILVEEDEK